MVLYVQVQNLPKAYYIIKNIENRHENDFSWKNLKNTKMAHSSPNLSEFWWFWLKKYLKSDNYLKILAWEIQFNSDSNFMFLVKNPYKHVQSQWLYFCEIILLSNAIMAESCCILCSLSFFSSSNFSRSKRICSCLSWCSFSCFSFRMSR